MNQQCPTCSSYIDIQEGVGYCILCDEIVARQEEEMTNDLIDINDLPL